MLEAYLSVYLHLQVLGILLTPVLILVIWFLERKSH